MSGAAVSGELARREPRGSVHRVSAAQQRAERIRSHLAGAAEEYAQAVLEDDWDALGYADVAQWAADQFGQAKFTPEARRQVAELLSARGKTVRQIAAATGVSKSVAGEDVARVRKPDTGSSRQQAARQREERKQQEASAPVSGAVIVPAEPLAREPDSVPEPHVHAYKMRCECGQEDKAFSADFDALEALAEKKYRQQVAGLAAEVARLEDENAELRRRRAADGPGRLAPAIAPAAVPQAASRPHAAAGDDLGDPAPDYEDFGDMAGDDDPWPGFSDELPDYEASQARERRGRA